MFHYKVYYTTKDYYITKGVYTKKKGHYVREVEDEPHVFLLH